MSEIRRPIARRDEWHSESPTRQLAVIWPLLGRTIAFHRRLVEITSTVKAAVLLSQAIYWTRHGRDIERAEGWFVKTVGQWELETGLTEREQATVRTVLRRLTLISERRTGVPAKLHFRVNTGALSQLLAESAGWTTGSPDWADAVAVAELLGPALGYHRSLARIAQSVHAGLLLSRALHLTRLQSMRRHDPWIIRTASKWTEELGLTRREQECARRDLLSAGVWEESYTGYPPRVATRVRLDSLFGRLAVCDLGVFPGAAGTAHHEGCVATDRHARNVGACRRKSHLLVATKPPSQFQRNRHVSFDDTATSLIHRSTSNLVQPPYAREPLSDAVPLSGGGELIFPESLQPEEQAAARALVERCGDHAQALLDELSGRMQANGVRTNPIAYLRGLVARASNGTFVPEAGLRVAVARRHRTEEAVERQNRELESQRLEAERESPEHQAKRAARRTEIRQWLDSVKASRQGGGHS